MDRPFFWRVSRSILEIGREQNMAKFHQRGFPSPTCYRVADTTNACRKFVVRPPNRLLPLADRRRAITLTRREGRRMDKRRSLRTGGRGSPRSLPPIDEPWTTARFHANDRRWPSPIMGAAPCGACGRSLAGHRRLQQENVRVTAARRSIRPILS